MNKNTLRKIATETRQELFDNKDNISRGTANHLAGLCGYGAVLLYHRLADVGIDSEVLSSNGHFFVKCGEYLMDITASQFGQSKVCIKNFENVSKIVESGNINWWFWRATFKYDAREKVENLGFDGRLKKLNLIK